MPLLQTFGSITESCAVLVLNGYKFSGFQEAHTKEWMMSYWSAKCDNASKYATFCPFNNYAEFLL